MSQEMEKNDQLENEISQDVLPKSGGYVENSLLEVGKSMARHSIGEVPSIPVKELNEDKAIANALSEIQVDDPNFKNLDPITDQGIFDIGAVAIAKAEAEKEVVSDPKTKAKLTGFEKTVAKKISKALYRSTNLGLTIALAACGIRTAIPTVTPDATPIEPTVTIVAPTATNTATPHPIYPTQLPTAENCPKEIDEGIDNFDENGNPIYEHGVPYGFFALAPYVHYKFCSLGEAGCVSLKQVDDCPPRTDDLKFDGFHQATDGNYYLDDGDANIIWRPHK